MTIGFVALTENDAQAAAGLQWLHHLLNSLRRNHPDLRMVLFTDRRPAPDLSGVTYIDAPSARNWWQRLWAGRQWQTLLAQHGVDTLVFWGMPGWFKSSLPQALVLTAADFNQKRVVGLRKPRFASLLLFVANEAAKANLHTLLGGQRTITVLRGAMPRPALLEVDPQVVKDRFTEGAEFFLYQGPLHHTASAVHLLKAFSRFKHRQKSGFKLLLVPDDGQPVKELQQLLATYKYRQDVVLAEGLHAEALESVYAAAWCFVFPATPSYWSGPLVQALQWQLPVVATEACREWAGNAGLYFEAGNEVQLAEHLMYIYKDENSHRRMREAALQVQEKFSWQPLVQQLGL